MRKVSMYALSALRFYAKLAKAQRFEDSPVKERKPLPRQGDSVEVSRSRPGFIRQSSVMSVMSGCSMAQSSDVHQDVEPIPIHQSRRKGKSFTESGLWLFYRKCCSGHYKMIAFALFLTAWRATDVPIYTIMLNYMFSAFDHLTDSGSDSKLSEFEHLD